jgi:hypothetical protein
VHFQSPRVRNGEQPSLKNLNKIEVRETDGISCELHLSQDGKDIVVEVSTGELHFEEVDEGLIIYVHREEKLQALCFFDRLPQALPEWIMTDPVTRDREPFSEKALRVLSTVLHAETKYVGLILARAGIMSVEAPNDEADDGDGVVGTAEEDSNSKQEAHGLSGNTSLGDVTEELKAIRLAP